MTFVITGGQAREQPSAAMAIPVRFPDLEHWKAQVKCQAGCPVATDAGRYVQLIAEGRDEDAFLVARAPNPFASVCGRVCAAPCEDACRRGSIDAPISIRALKRFVTEQYGVESRRPDTQARLLRKPTGALLGLEGSGAFGAASLALLCFTHGPAGARILLAASLLVWMVAPALLAARRLDRAGL